ncbi:MAG TPA: UDP-glucose 4-epimerase GalE [Clostridiales bacterium]|nr:UDP-glucose 4-epimerase GalE [Clostridiales bacterium]
MAILVTGGTGYIGSHTVIELINAGYEVIILDNLSNSKIEALNRIKQITGKDVKFYKTDLLDMDGLEKVFKENQITDVVHFAGLKAVGESVSIPLRYYYNNITGTINLLAAMQKEGVKNIVFSSSATVYGVPKSVPIKEDALLSATNPYGRTKLFIEQIIKDQNVADPSLNAAILRYFNPIGAHESGLIGEDPNGIPNNLVPYITQVAVGRLENVQVFGNDYPTHDGTGVRDYIHVVDLALGHIAALKKLKTNPGVVVYNLGTGQGYSVLEIINAFSEVVGSPIPYEFAPRRPGDIAASFADPSLAKQELSWEAKRDLMKMCQDSWNWQKKNPNGLE